MHDVYSLNNRDNMHDVYSLNVLANRRNK